MRNLNFKIHVLKSGKQNIMVSDVLGCEFYTIFNKSLKCTNIYQYTKGSWICYILDKLMSIFE